MEVLINDEILGTGEGKSKKSAEKIAAKNAFHKMTSPNVKSTPNTRFKPKRNKFHKPDTNVVNNNEDTEDNR